MIRKPNKVRIHQDTFKIYWVDKLDQCKGCTETATASIFVDTSFDELTQRHVLFHEILHGIYYAYHLNPPTDYEETEIGLADALEEFMVSVYAPAILQVMNDNPSVFKYIFNVK